MNVRTKLFLTHLLSYVTIFLLPLIVFIVFLQTSVFGMLTDEIINNSTINLEKAQGEIEANISFIIGDEQYIYFNELLNSFDLEVDSYEGILVQERLKNYMATNNFVHDIIYYQSNANYIISSLSSYEKTVFFNDVYSFANITDGKFVLNENNPINFKGTFSTAQSLSIYGEHSYLTYTIPLYNSSEQLVLLISYEQLDNIFATTYFDDSYTYILDDNHQIIYSSDEYIETHIDEYTAGEDEVVLDGKSYLSITRHSDMLNWSYTTLIPMDSLMSQLANVQMQLIILSTLAIILAGVVIIFLMKRTYLPLLKIYDVSNEILTTDKLIPENDAYEYIRASLLSLNTQNKLLSNNIEESKDDIRDRLLIKLFYSEFKEGVNIFERTSSLGIDFIGKQYIFCVIRGDEHISELSNKIIELFSGNIPRNITVVPLVQASIRQIVIMLLSEDLYQEDISASLSSTIKKINKTLYIDLTIGVSECATSLYDCKSALQQATIACDYRLIYGSNTIIPYSTVKKHSDSDVFYFKSNDLLEQLEKYDIVTTRAYVKELKSIFVKTLPTISLTRTFCYKITTTVSRWLNSLDAEYTEIKRITESKINDLAYETIDNYIDEVLLIIEYITAQYKQTAPTIDKYSAILHYIDMNYADPMLTMERVANEFSMSPSNISRYFKNNNGVTMSEYISTLRINKAKALLQNTDLPITQISDDIGFSNSKTFSRRFKQLTDMSPKEYRQEQKLEFML